MSGLPASLTGSILQTPLAQRHVSALRDAERVQTAAAQRQQVAAISEKDSTVETTDGDTRAHADSEGQGSQGRAFTDSGENPQEPPADAKPAEGHLIDFEA